MDWLQHLISGNLAAARMLREGLRAGDTVYIDTQTAPTPSKKCVIKATIARVNEDSTFDTHECDPYFGYNKNWLINQIVK